MRRRTATAPAAAQRGEGQAHADDRRPRRPTPELVVATSKLTGGTEPPAWTAAPLVGLDEDDESGAVGVGVATPAEGGVGAGAVTAVLLVGVGFGDAFVGAGDVGGGGTATAWLGATLGFGLVAVVLSLENDQPSKPPGITRWLTAPWLLYFHAPPFGAYQ